MIKRLLKSIGVVVGIVVLYLGGVGLAHVATPDKNSWGMGPLFAEMLFVGVFCLIGVGFGIRHWWKWVVGK